MKQDVLAHQNDAPDKSEWIMTPFTVNACYNPSANDITFPPPFCNRRFTT